MPNIPDIVNLTAQPVTLRTPRATVTLAPAAMPTPTVRTRWRESATVSALVATRADTEPGGAVRAGGTIAPLCTVEQVADFDNLPDPSPDVLYIVDWDVMMYGSRAGRRDLVAYSAAERALFSFGGLTDVL